MPTCQEVVQNLRIRRMLGEKITMERLNKAVEQAMKKGWETEYEGEETIKEPPKRKAPDEAYNVY